MPSSSRYTFHPLTLDRWGDLEALFGPRGACAGCWCMYWRLPRSQWSKGKTAGNRRAFRKLVADGALPGILAYAGDEPAGWCAIAPRRDYPGLDRSRVLKPVDDKPVWSVSCFYVRRDHRLKGLTVLLLKAAARFAAEHGARVVEGYPIDPSSADKMPGPWAWTGLAASFLKAGFKEVERRSPTRPIMRRAVRGR
jgi:GNAT superfamily N-acetyltransferase